MIYDIDRSGTRARIKNFFGCAARIGVFVAIVWCSQNLALAIDESNLVFYSSFDNGFTPEVSRGSADTDLIGSPQLVPGKRMGAIEVSNLADGLLYQTSGNFPSGEGTISFWISPVDWDINSTDDFFFPLIGTHPQPERTVITIQGVWPYNKIGLINWPFYTPNAPDPAGGFPICRQALADLTGGIEGEATMNLRPGNWYHLVFTWRKGKLVAYSNGNPGGTAKHPQIRVGSLSKTFFLGYGGWDQPMFLDPGCENEPKPIQGRKKRWKYRIDDLAIFDRAMHRSQVRNLYQYEGGAQAYARQGDVAPIDLGLFYYNHKNQLKVVVENITPDDTSIIQVRIREDGSSATLAKFDLSFDSIEGRFLGKFDASALPQKRLVVQAFVTFKNGQEARSEEKTFSRRVPIWIGNSYGTEDRVLAPWTPVEVHADSTSVWGRRYVYGDDLTLREVHTDGKQILAHPMALRIRQAKQQSKFVRQASVSNLIRESKTENIRQVTGKLGSLRAELKATTSFDGFIRWDVRLTPDQPTQVEALSLEIPIKKEFAHWFHTSHRRGARAPTMPLSGQFPYDQKFGSGGATWSIAFHDGERGFQWAMGSNRDWHNVDIHKQINVIPSADEMLIRLNIIDLPTTLSEPVSYSFSFQGLPVKPMPHPYGDAPWPFVDRDNGVIWDPPIPWERLYRGKFAFGIGFRAPPYYLGEVDKLIVRHVKHVLHSPGGRDGDFAFSKDTPDEDLLGWQWQPGEIPRQSNRMNYTFMNTIWSSLNKPPYPLTDVAEIYGTDWATTSDVVPPRAQWKAMPVCPTEEYRDYLAFWTHERAMKEIGIYFDHSPPRFCSNLEHGHGWVDDHGRVHPEIPIFDIRKAEMRAYAAFKEVKPYGMMMQHISGTMFMGANAFCDYVLDGENISRWSDRVRAREENGGYWSESLPMDYAMTLYNPRPWGVMNAGCWQMYDMVIPELHYDNHPDLYYITLRNRLRPEFVRDLRTVMFQMGRPEELGGYSIYGAWGNEYPMENVSNFMGWWKQTAFTGLGPLYLGYWPAGRAAANRLMVTVGNLTFEDQTREITVDVEKVLQEVQSGDFVHSSNYKVLTVIDVETNEKLPVTGATVTVNIGKKDYRNLTFVWSEN